MRERDRSGWKLGSPPLLLHPCPAVSMLDGDSRTSSGRGGAPGSPGLGRLDEDVEEGVPMLQPEAESPHFCSDGRLRELPTLDVEGLCSLSGWNKRVEVFEKVVGSSLVVLGELKAPSDEDPKAPAADVKNKENDQKNPKDLQKPTDLLLPLRDSSFSFLAFCTSSVILAMMKFCERSSLMESTRASRPRGFSARMSSNVAVLFVCVVLQLISSASSRVRMRRDRR